MLEANINDCVAIRPYNKKNFCQIVKLKTKEKHDTNIDGASKYVYTAECSYLGSDKFLLDNTAEFFSGGNIQIEPYKGIIIEVPIKYSIGDNVKYRREGLLLEGTIKSITVHKEKNSYTQTLYNISNYFSLREEEIIQ